MRPRFSAWDLVVVPGVLIEVWTAIWLMDHLEAPVPLHWGLSGEPDRFGEPSLPALLLGPIIAALLYVGLRAIDVASASRRPASYGFLSDLGGGLAVFVLLLGGSIQWSTWSRELTPSPLLLVGLMFVYIGWQISRNEAVPINTAGLVPDTPAARAVVRRTLGRGFVVIGGATAVTALLPGSWSVVALLLLLIGPLATLAVAVVRAGTGTEGSRDA